MKSYRYRTKAWSKNVITVILPVAWLLAISKTAPGSPGTFLSSHKMVRKTKNIQAVPGKLLVDQTGDETTAKIGQDRLDSTYCTSWEAFPLTTGWKEWSFEVFEEMISQCWLYLYCADIFAPEWRAFSSQVYTLCCCLPACLIYDFSHQMQGILLHINYKNSKY